MIPALHGHEIPGQDTIEDTGAAPADRAAPRLKMCVTLPAHWRVVVAMNRAIEAYARVLFADEDVVQALTMACTELMENAIKYADPDRADEPPQVKLHLNVDSLTVALQVGNSVRARPEHRRALEDTLSALRTASDLASVYHEKMMNVFSGATAEGGLGLVRIAYEGRCALDYRISEQGSIEVEARLPTSWHGEGVH
jgi:hypothetical protein